MPYVPPIKKKIEPRHVPNLGRFGVDLPPKKEARKPRTVAQARDDERPDEVYCFFCGETVPKKNAKKISEIKPRFGCRDCLRHLKNEPPAGD